MLFYPDSRHTQTAPGGGSELIDPTAELEEGVVVEPGAVIGAEARIGRGTRIAAGAVVGYRVTIGRDTYIGPLATVTHALVGDRVSSIRACASARMVSASPWARAGTSRCRRSGGSSSRMTSKSVPIRPSIAGALKDTVIGEGTKIDNLVQIGHNAVMGGTACWLPRCGVAGSAELGDFVVMGGQSGVVGHIKVGAGAQIAGTAHRPRTCAGRPHGRDAGAPSEPVGPRDRLLTRMAKRGDKDDANEG